MKHSKGGGRMSELVSVTLRCSRGHEITLRPTFTTEGGCFGHDSGEYCYCGSAEVRIGYSCPKCAQALGREVHESFLVPE